MEKSCKNVFLFNEMLTPIRRSSIGNSVKTNELLANPTSE